ncbi:MAG: BadF/BadG/BcrA/BcrD ATPase family protein, partial [Verrucomicrobiota bacterium]
MNPQSLFVGIDGGGTHSYAIAVNESGRVVATAQSGSLNFHGGGLDRARTSLSQLIESLQLPEIHRAANYVIGCAALFTEATHFEKEQFCGGIVPLDRTRLVGDCVTAFHGASLGKPGVLIISGTGSIVLVRNEAGNFSQLGGWGHLLGDAGSAWWIALESVKAAIAASEGLGPRTNLTQLICRFF